MPNPYNLRPRRDLAVTCFQGDLQIPAEAKGTSGNIEPIDERCPFCGASTLQDFNYDDLPLPLSQAESLECESELSEEEDLPDLDDIDFIVHDEEELE